MNFTLWNVYQKYVSEVVLFNAVTDQKNISFWRNKIFLGMLSYLTPISLIALIPGVYMSFTNNLPIVGCVDIFAFLMLIIILIKRNISLQKRKLIFISVFYCLSIVLIYYVGKAGPGLLFLLATTLISSIIYSRSAGYYSAFANTLICVIFGFLNYFEIQIPVALDYPLGAWIAITSNLVILSFACAKCLDLLLEGLDLSLRTNKTGEEQLQKVNHLYAFISQVNQNIVRVKDEATLYRNSCKMAIEFGKFKMAWIGLFDFENKTISLIEQCGIGNEDLHLFTHASFEIQGPQDHVLNTGNYYICNDIQNDLELENWKGYASVHGINSCMVLPLKKSGKIVGTFNLYSSEINFSGKEEIALLVEVTNDISFALDLFEKTKLHDDTRTLLSNNEKKFRNTLDGMFEGIQIHDFNFRYLYVNDALVKLSTYTREELIGFTLMDKYPGIEQSDLFKSIERCLTERVSEHLETTFTFPNGTKADFELSIEPIPEGVTILSIDRTEYNKEKEKVLKANRLYAFISAINQSIVHINDEQELLDNACKVATDIGQFKLARIDLIDEQKGTLNIVSKGGSKTDTIKKHSGISCADLILSGTPTGRVLGTGKFAVSNNMQNDASMAPWKKDLLENNIKAGMCLPIKKFGKVVGVFGFYSAVENIFDDQEIALLTEATSDISFALENFEKTKKHAEIEKLVIKKEKHFRGLVENSADAVAIISPSGSLLYVSPSIERVLGYSESEIMKLDMFSLFHPDDLEEMGKVWAHVLTTKGIPIPGHTGRMLHKDGSWRWIEATVTNMLHDPAINGIVDNFRDVTDKIKAEELILKNEKRFRALIEESTDMIMLTSLEGKIVYGSATIPKTFGYSLDEFLHKSAFDFFHPDDLPHLIKNRAIILETPGRSFSFRYRLLHKNGNWIWCEGTLANMFHEPEIQAFVSNFRDISEKKKAEEQLEFDKNNSSALINNTSDLMWSVDRNFNLITSNIPFDEMAKINFGKVIAKGESILSISNTAEMLNDFKKIYERAFAGETFTETAYFDIPFEFWSEISYYPIRKGNEIIGCACHSRDITFAKLAERQLQKSEAFSNGILNSLNSHIAVLDASGIIVAVNESWKRFALENGETTLSSNGVGVNYYEVCEKSANAGAKEAFEASKGIKEVMTGNKTSFYLEYSCHSPNEKRWFGMRVLKFESNESMVVIAHQNISERKLAEENLQKSESRLNEAQGIAHLGNWEMDFKTNVHTWSDELYNIVGVNKGDVTPSTELFLSFIHPDDLEQIKIQVDEAFKTLKATSYNFRFIKKDGSVRYGYTERRFEFDKNNEPTRLLGVVQDITERKLIEDEREKMILSIVQHTKNLEQFASIVSHNLRAPVANILGLSNVLQNNISESDKIRSQQFLFKATEQLDIVLKDLNKILQVKSEINEYKEEVNFQGLVNAIESSIQTQIEEETVEITTDFSKIEKIISVKSYIHSIFYNLISNSIKYRQIGKASVIKIKSKIINEKIQISFKDNGTGIDLVKHGTKLFGLYNRFHPYIEGKGIGLFMVKTQLETLGGSIQIKSKPGEGAEFIIELPFSEKIKR